MDQTEIKAEIVALHDFISSWFRGEPENSRVTYNTGFADRLIDVAERTRRQQRASCCGT